MSERYSQWRRLRGDLDRPDLVDYGKRMLGYLNTQRELSGVTSMATTHEMPDGSVVHARFNGDQPEVFVRAPTGGGGAWENIYCLYVTSDEGLLVYDMGRKARVLTVSGLEHYEVDAVAAGGETVFLTGGLYDRMGEPGYPHGPYQGFGVRADLKTMNAVSTSGMYAMASARRGAYLPFTNPGWYEYTFEDAYPMITGAALSPNGETIVWHFGAERAGDGTILSGIGGYIVADATTLAAKRSCIRTHGQPSAVAWAPNSDHFFASSCYDTEHPDGVWWIVETVSPYWTATPAATPESMYIVKYTADGEIAESVHVVDWVSAAGEPYPTGMAASSEYVFILYYSDPFATQTLAAYRTSDLVLAGSVTMSGIFGDLCLMGNGNIALVYAPGGVRVFRFSEGAFEVVEDTGNAVLGTNAVQTTNSAVQEHRNGVVQKFPRGGKAQTPPVSFYYLRDTEQRVVRGFYSFTDEEGGVREGGYALDITDDAPNERYRIACVGSRQTRKAA